MFRQGHVCGIATYIKPVQTMHTTLNMQRSNYNICIPSGDQWVQLGLPFYMANCAFFFHKTFTIVVGWPNYGEPKIHINFKNVKKIVACANIGHLRYAFWNPCNFFFLDWDVFKFKILRFSINQSVYRVTQYALPITYFCENRYSALFAYPKIWFKFCW